MLLKANYQEAAKGVFPASNHALYKTYNPFSLSSKGTLKELLKGFYKECIKGFPDIKEFLKDSRRISLRIREGFR